MRCDPSSWVRQRVGEVSVDWLLPQTIESERASGAMKRESLSTIVHDTTLQSKAIAHPTPQLLNRAREQLVDAEQDWGHTASQSSVRVDHVAEHRAGRNAHARQTHAPGDPPSPLRT